MSAKPSARARLRPLELVGGSAIIGVFIGLVVILGTREWLTGLEWAGVSFIGALVIVAMLLLATTPKDERPDADGPRGDADPGSDEEPRGH